MFDIFTRRKKKKLLEEFKARRHAEDDLLTPEERQAFDEIIADFAASPLSEFKRASEVAQTRLLPVVRPYSWIRNLLDLLIVVGAVAFGIRGLFFQPFKIPTGSMQPTLYGIHYMESTPLGKNLWHKLPEKARMVLLPLLLTGGLVLSSAYLVDATYNPFLYFRF